MRASSGLYIHILLWVSDRKSLARDENSSLELPLRTGRFFRRALLLFRLEFTRKRDGLYGHFISRERERAL